MTGTKKYDKKRLGGKGDPLGIVQETGIMHKSESILKNEIHKIPRGFEIQTDHLISARRPDLVIVDKREKTCQIVDFAALAEYRVKTEEK